MRFKSTNKHLQAVAAHERAIVKMAQKKADELRDPRTCQDLGLPEDLPESTRKILGHTQALSKLGPKRPRIDKVRWSRPY